MQNIVQVLGADIPHHNSTILSFFERLAEGGTPRDSYDFILVSKKKIDTADYPHLVIQQFMTKRELAKHVTQLAKNRQQRFFFHGQFNPWIWLALLRGKLRRPQVYWHIWGADFYETAKSWDFRLYYRLRRLLQGKFQEVFATQGDAWEYQKRYPGVKITRLYFPARQPSVCKVIEQKSNSGELLTILLGNSGDPSNRHLDGLGNIHRMFGEQVKIILPMGYPENNERYITEVEEFAKTIFVAEQVQVIRNKLCFADFIELVASCELGYFPFERQQGVGTLCLFIMHNIPILLSRKNQFWQDLVSQQLPVLFDTDRISADLLVATKRQMQECDKGKISFMYPSYEADWKTMLQRLYSEDRKC